MQPDTNAEPASMRLKQRVFHLLESGSGSAAAHLIDAVMVALILINVLVFVCDSVPSLDARYRALFVAIEHVTVLAFTIEYALRLWVCTEHPPLRMKGPLRGRLIFALRPYMLIDLAAILPFYLSAFLPIDLMVLRVLRLVRFLKLARFSPALSLLGRVIIAERRALMATLVIVLGLLLVSATAMHLAEQGAQPEKFGTIPDAMWWAITTLTTVGYGDAVPVTPLGRMIGGAVMLLGLGMLAMPVSILATGFVAEAHRREFVITFGMVARVPLFSELDSRAVSEITALLRSEIVPAETIIVRRGERADAMYFIAAGEVVLETAEAPVHLRHGDFFGEVALLAETTRQATARALTRCDLLVIAADDFRALMRKRPELSFRIREVARHALIGDWGHTGVQS